MFGVGGLVQISINQRGNTMQNFPSTRRPAFPVDLAEKIARKAEIMGKRLEEQAIAEMVRTAKAALGRGESPGDIEAQLGLK